MTVKVGDAYHQNTLLDYIDIARKRWRWILLPTLIVTAGFVYLGYRQPDVYESKSNVLLADTPAQRTLDPSSQNPSFLSREMSNEISLARSDSVESLVEEALGRLPDVEVTSESEADVLVFTASAGTAERAALYANTWAEMYVKVKQDAAVQNITVATSSLQDRLEELRLQRQKLRAPLDALDEQISRSDDVDESARLQRDFIRLTEDLRYELELVTSQAEATVGNLTELELQAELSSVGEARIIVIAERSTSTSNPPVSRNLAVGMVLGLLAGAALALFAEMRDNTLKSANDVQSSTDLPVLASIPVASKRERQDLGLVTFRDAKGVLADGFHKVRSSLEFASFESDIRSVLITSPNPSEGKSTTSANLALSLASVGRKTVLVDLDFRRSRVHEIFSIDQAPGLSDYILKDESVSGIAYSIDEPGLDDLLVVPTGTVPPSPASFVGTQGFLETLDWIKGQADMVVYDAPPLLAVSDAHTLARHVDAVILTAMAGKTTKDELLEVVSSLRQVGANLVGVVLLGVQEVDGYYGRQYYGSDSDVKKKSKSANDGGLWGERDGDRQKSTSPAVEVASRA